MIYFTATTDTLDIVTSSAAQVDVQANYIDAASSTLIPSGAGRQNTTISSATSTTILSAPGASTTRTLKQLTVRNLSTTTANTVTIEYDQNATFFEIYATTLQPGEELIYIEGLGFNVYATATSDRLLTSSESGWTQRILMPPLAHHGTIHTFVMISGTAYYVYVGRVATAITPKFVEFYVTGNGAGAQTAEVGLYSTPTSPSKAAQTLTRIAASGTVDSLTSSGVKRNTTAFATAVSAGTHLWAAMRTAMATTQPTLGGIASDLSQGSVLTTTGGGALTGVASASGLIVAAATTTVSPYLSVTLD
jgi:hypothetical protein